MAVNTKVLANTKWFFIIIAAIVLFLSWKIVQPLALTIVTAGVFAIVMTPVERRLRKLVKFPKLSSFLMVLITFALIILPFFFIAVLLVDQANTILGLINDDSGFLKTFDITSFAFYQSLPASIQDWLVSLDVAQIGKGAAEWAVNHVGSTLSDAVKLLLNISVFFIALYYLLLDRDRLYKEVLILSPLKDKLDAQILHRIISTIRNVVFGALIVAIIQALLATIGMTIFGVPGSILWGSLVIIAAQVPLIGVGLIMVPAVSFLIATGNIGAAIGLTIWAVIVVGLVDNLLSPFIIQGRTKMHALLILISILGALQYLGPIGFIIGPTILASFLVVIDLYKSGILAKEK